MVNAILYVVRTGIPWRDLPLQYGPWKSVYTRFRRWSRSGLWDKIFSHISKNCNNKCNMIDSTVIKVHQHASGTKGGHFFKAIGRSGLPLKFYFTEGKTHDSVPASSLMDNLVAKNLIADKAYGGIKAAPVFICRRQFFNLTIGEFLFCP